MGFIRDVFQRQKITHVIHTAGIRISEASNRHLKALEINVMGTGHLLEVIRLTERVIPIVATSTVALYDTGQPGKTVDENHRRSPDTPYTTSKSPAKIYANFAGCLG